MTAELPASLSPTTRARQDAREFHGRGHDWEQVGVLQLSGQFLRTWPNSGDRHRRRGVAGRGPADNKAIVLICHREWSILAGEHGVQKSAPRFVGVGLIF